jgi:hypothetical protein
MRSFRRLAAFALPVLLGTALAAGTMLVTAVQSGASTPACSVLGPACGDNVNVFGNGWDVFRQRAAVDTKIVSWPNTISDPATDFTRTGTASAGWRFQYAPRGVFSGLCVSDPGGGDPYDATPDGIELRACNTSGFQKFREGNINGTAGTQLVNNATGKPVLTNGKGAQLTGGGGYTGGSFWKWLGGPVAGATQMSFALYANGDSLATCHSGNPVLDAGTAAGTSAQVDVVNPPPAAPSAEPSFTASTFGGGGPRWVIELHNGMYIFGYPDEGLTAGTEWAVNPGGPQTVSYATAVADARAGGLDNWVTAAFIVDDAGFPGHAVTLAGVQYNGQHFTC